MAALLGSMSMYHMPAIPAEVRRGASGTVVTDNRELPSGYWEPKPGPLQEQYVLLTAEPSPQPLMSLS